MISEFLAIFSVSLILQIILAKLALKCSFCIDLPRRKGGSLHKTHKNAVPRIGGLGLFLPFLAAVFFLGMDWRFILPFFGVFIVGFAEDIFHILDSEIRLLLLALFSSLAVIFYPDAVLLNVGMDLPLLLAIPFTVFAFTGLANSANIIDGINGLSSGIFVLGFAFMGLSAYTAGDILLFNLSAALFAVLLAFFLLNFFFGLVFMGDGGAYFMGFSAAVLSALLINRNPAISPWFPVILFSYPVIDTLFSMYRRKFVSRKNAMAADKLHLHILLANRVFKKSKHPSLALILSALCIDFTALFFRQHTFFLMYLFVLLSMFYIFVYNLLVKFRARKSFIGQMGGIL